VKISQHGQKSVSRSKILLPRNAVSPGRGDGSAQCLGSLVTCDSYSCCCMTLKISQSLELSYGLLVGHTSGVKKLTVLHCSSWTVLNARWSGAGFAGRQYCHQQRV